MSAKLIVLNDEVHILSVTKQISDRKQIEKELISAKEKAEESNRLKTEFFNNMSHEIRTPMNGIIGFTDMLTDSDLSEEQRNRFITIVQNSSYRLLKVIDSILEISSLETNQVQLNEGEFSLNQLVDEVYSSHIRKAHKKGLTIHLNKSLNDSESTIISDKEKLNKVLDKVMDNALKYTTNGQIDISYRTEKETLKLYIKDTGIGITTKKKETIFEPFRQENTSLSRQYGGLGVGLAIAKHYTILLGGDITFESIENNGTTFTISLPFNPVLKNKDMSDTANRINDLPNNQQNFPILIVEDEVINHMLLEAILEDQTDINYTCIHAKNGQEAVNIIKANKEINLILMDLKMPIMDGFEATRKIKDLRAHIPIIAQTSYSTEHDKKMALEAGCDEFITKPINKERFLELINKYRLKRSN